jgi:hypothetical protein
MSLEKTSLVVFLCLSFMLGMLALVFANYKFDFKPCKIIRTPTVITESGSYCLGNDLSGSETLITIKQDHVRFDLSGYRLTGSSDRGSMAPGIEITAGHDIRIVGGLIRGFFMGIHADLPVDPKDRPTLDREGISVRNISIRDSAFRGISIKANNTVVENNLVYNTGGTKVYENSYAIGIEVSGYNSRIDSNTVVDTVPVGIGEGVGISLSNFGENGIIKNNFIVNNVEPKLYGRTIGIWSGDVNEGSRPIFVNNVVKHFMFAMMYSNEAFASENIFIGTRCLNTAQIIKDPKNRIRNHDLLSENRWLEKQPNCLERPETYLKLAEGGDAEAQFVLARIYRDGFFVAPNVKKSHYWLELAAKNGHPEAKRVYPFWIKEN